MSLGTSLGDLPRLRKCRRRRISSYDKRDGKGRGHYVGCNLNIIVDDDNQLMGKNTLYRFHIEDPIMFEKSIKVIIEHRRANNLSNDYSNTAYWYQTEPHKQFPTLLPIENRLPREDK